MTSSVSVGTPAYSKRRHRRSLPSSHFFLTMTGLQLGSAHGPPATVTFAPMSSPMVPSSAPPVRLTLWTSISPPAESHPFAKFRA